jgi:hypothetical protein
MRCIFIFLGRQAASFNANLGCDVGKLGFTDDDVLFKLL